MVPYHILVPKGIVNPASRTLGGGVSREEYGEVRKKGHKRRAQSSNSESLFSDFFQFNAETTEAESKFLRDEPGEGRKKRLKSRAQSFDPETVFPAFSQSNAGFVIGPESAFVPEYGFSRGVNVKEENDRNSAQGKNPNFFLLDKHTARGILSEETGEARKKRRKSRAQSSDSESFFPDFSQFNAATGRRTIGEDGEPPELASSSASARPPGCTV